MDQADELNVLLNNPTFIEQIITSDPFLDWNLDLAINRIHLSPEESVWIFLQPHLHHTVGLQDTPPSPLPPLPPNLPDLWRSIVNSNWLRNNDHEPKVDGCSVLGQMLVPYDPTDTSTSSQLRWICGVSNPSKPNGICGYVSRRRDRGITHIRAKHLNHRPYPCDGGCGVPHWYVTL